MLLHARSLKVGASFVLALAAVGCSSDPGIPGSGYHSVGGGTGGGTTSSGGTASSGGGTTSSGGNGATGSSSGGTSSGGSSGATGSSSGTTGSSGGTSSGGGSTVTISASTTWSDGQQLAQSVVIAAGATVTIAPGATITAASGVSITIQGTLTASSATGTHAKLTGTSWTGLVVDTGGTLSLDGVDISGAGTALQTNAGATSAEYDDGTITAATTPFNIAKGTSLGTKHATVTGTLGSSRVSGSFTASYLDYDSNGNEGIVTEDPTAVESIEDSKLHGSGPVADMVVSAAGASSIHIAYTDITNVHCGFHFDAIDSFDVSYTNVESNAYGFMLYGSSGTGTRSVSYSNIDQNQVAYDTEGNNGPITFDHDYVTGTTNPGTAVSAMNPETAAVTGTGPRP